MPHRNRVIVVDDKTEDGDAIVKCLWKLQIPSFFLHYDEKLLVDLDESKKFVGIRFIFQDIANRESFLGFALEFFVSAMNSAGV